MIETLGRTSFMMFQIGAAWGAFMAGSGPAEVRQKGAMLETFV